MGKRLPRDTLLLRSYFTLEDFFSFKKISLESFQDFEEVTSIGKNNDRKRFKKVLTVIE